MKYSVGRVSSFFFTCVLLHSADCGSFSLLEFCLSTILSKVGDFRLARFCAETRATSCILPRSRNRSALLDEAEILIPKRPRPLALARQLSVQGSRSEEGGLGLRNARRSTGSMGTGVRELVQSTQGCKRSFLTGT